MEKKTTSKQRNAQRLDLSKVEIRELQVPKGGSLRVRTGIRAGSKRRRRRT